jgi:hypothetical protein
MDKIRVLVAAFGLTSCFLLGSVSAGTEVLKPPALASANWSVDRTQSLDSNPPPADLIWDFVNRAVQGNPEQGHLCKFRFADLRRSGNLSLVVSVDGGGNGGCNQTFIFDKTDSGFESYSSWAFFSGDEDVQDINHDGKLELILWAPIAGPDEIGEECEWPLVFAWTGIEYSEVSNQYRGYYERYLKSLEKQIAAGSSAAGEVQARAAGKILGSQPTTISGFQQSVGESSSIALNSASIQRRPIIVPAPAASTLAPAISRSTPDPRDYACDSVQAAKTEQFLGNHSDASMIAAIKDAESNDPDRRTLAAVIFSFMKTPEATADLKTLANDSDPEVAKPAKDLLTEGTEPDDYYREIKMEPVQWSGPIQ